MKSPLKAVNSGTSASYSIDGEAFIPSGLENYSRLGFDITTAYGVSHALTLYARLTWLYNDVDHPLHGATSFGFGDQTLGASADVWTSETGHRLSLQIQGDFPTYDNAKSESEQTPWVGDGSVDFTAGALFSFALDPGSYRKWALVGGAGHTTRSQDFSSAFPWSLALHHDSRAKGVFWDFGGYGFRSRFTDPSPSRIRDKSSGRSFIINAINPTLITLRGRFGIRFSNTTSAQLTIANAVMGESAARGILVGIGATFQLGKPSGDGPSSRNYGEAKKGFVSYAVDATVTRVNDKLNIVKIDKGSSDDVGVGQVFDIYQVRKDGQVGGVVARAEVISIKRSSSALKVIEYYKEVWIEPGFIARSFTD
jgi:hypothetical protein